MGIQNVIQHPDVQAGIAAAPELANLRPENAAPIVAAMQSHSHQMLGYMAGRGAFTPAWSPSPRRAPSPIESEAYQEEQRQQLAKSKEEAKRHEAELLEMDANEKKNAKPPEKGESSQKKKKDKKKAKQRSRDSKSKSLGSSLATQGEVTSREHAASPKHKTFLSPFQEQQAATKPDVESPRRAAMQKELSMLSFKSAKLRPLSLSMPGSAAQSPRSPRVFMMHDPVKSIELSPSSPGSVGKLSTPSTWRADIKSNDPGLASLLKGVRSGKPDAAGTSHQLYSQPISTPGSAAQSPRPGRSGNMPDPSKSIDIPDSREGAIRAGSGREHSAHEGQDVASTSHQLQGMSSADRRALEQAQHGGGESSRDRGGSSQANEQGWMEAGKRKGRKKSEPAPPSEASMPLLEGEEEPPPQPPPQQSGRRRREGGKKKSKGKSDW